MQKKIMEEPEGTKQKRETNSLGMLAIRELWRERERERRDRE
jgi:hypothetical protein